MDYKSMVLLVLLGSVESFFFSPPFFLPVVHFSRGVPEDGISGNYNVD